VSSFFGTDPGRQNPTRTQRVGKSGVSKARLREREERGKRGLNLLLGVTRMNHIKKVKGEKGKKEVGRREGPDEYTGWYSLHFRGVEEGLKRGREPDVYEHIWRRETRAR